MKLLIIKFIPPILLSLLKIIKKKAKIIFFGKKPIYDQKIYHNYREANKGKYGDAVWESKNWINHVKNSLKLRLRPQYKLNIHEKAVIKSSQILSLLNFKYTHVIDYGGGPGVLIYPLFKFADENNINLKISVIDNKANIIIGQKKYSDKKNVHFYDYKKISDSNIFKINKSGNDGSILNISSVLQYVSNYKNFLKSILQEINPDIVCVTRFIRCENAEHDAYTVQNISTSFGFCGSTVVNLFGKNSLVETMKNLNYEILFKDYKYIGDAAHYFNSCDDEKYRKMTDTSYTFIKNKI